MEQPDYPVAKLQDGKAAGLSKTTVKRFPITVKDRITGDDIEVLAKLEMREVNVLSYGKLITFSMKAGSKTVRDSRDEKRKTLDFVKSELIRLVNEVEGSKLFATLIA